MNEQNDNRATAMRAENTIRKIFDVVRNEKEYRGPKYKNPKDIWMEGALRATLLYLELLHDTEVDKEYLAAIENEISHINRITKEFFKETPYVSEGYGKNITASSVGKTVSEGSSKNAKLAGTYSGKGKLSPAVLAHLSETRTENKIKAKIKEDNEAKINW